MRNGLGRSGKRVEPSMPEGLGLEVGGGGVTVDHEHSRQHNFELCMCVI